MPMDALVVVHVGLEDTLMAMPSELVPIHNQLCGRIAQEIEKYVRQGNKAYYLSEHGAPPNLELIYPSIRVHLPNMVYIPLVANYDEQFLRTKETLIKDNIQNIALSGVSYASCLMDIYLLLSRKITDLSRAMFWLASGNGWSKEEFDNIVNKRLNAQIRIDLTDRFLISEKV